jgi:hypothetical protein
VTVARLKARWQHLSVRHKLMALSLLPLLVVLPLLVAALVIWGNSAYDRLLITKVRSDLGVAHGYFGKVLSEVGAGTQAVANSHRLNLSLAADDMPALKTQLAQAQQQLNFDFVNLYSVHGELLTASWQDPLTSPSPTPTSALLRLLRQPVPEAQVQRITRADMLALAPHLTQRLMIPLISTQSASPSPRTQEDQAQARRHPA